MREAASTSRSGASTPSARPAHRTNEVAARRRPTALTPPFPRYSSRYEIRTGRQTDAFFLLMQHDPRHVAADGGKSVRYEDAPGGEEGGPKVRDPHTG